MISDNCGCGPPKTVIEVARKAAGLSQRQLADVGRDPAVVGLGVRVAPQVPDLEVVERLLEAADAELAIRPIVDFDVQEDPEIGQYLVPDRLWSVPMPDCFSKVQVLGVLFKCRRPRRVGPVGRGRAHRVLRAGSSCRGSTELMLDSVDGILLMQVWERLNLPEVIREAWQPVIDAATGVPRTEQPRDPAGFSALARQGDRRCSGGQLPGASARRSTQMPIPPPYAGIGRRGSLGTGRRRCWLP